MINNVMIDNVIVQEEIQVDDVMEFQKTTHSKKRCKQRGIKESDLQLIMELGAKVKKPGGVKEYFIGKRNKERIIQTLKHFIQKMDKLEGKAIIVDEDSCEIITAYHKDN